MTPRRYTMSARAEAAAARRAAVVDAAIGLFAEQTAAATTMDDVARAAGVAPATVYRQFGDFDGLARACAETAFDIAEVPTPEAAVAHLADLDTLDARLHRFIELSCECYQRARRWLAAERRERHLPAFERTVAREEAALDAIVTGLLEPVGVDAATRAVVTTLVDFPCWQELVRRGVAPADAADVVFDQVRAALARAGVTVHHPHEGDRP
jgi:AcrR family transcriptional regulator